MAKGIIVYTTVGKSEEAEKMAKEVIEKKLGACAQIEKINSFFYWDNKVNSSDELKLSIKTFDEKYDELESFIKENSSYDLPEIVSVEMDDVSDEYLNWMSEVLER